MFDNLIDYIIETVKEGQEVTIVGFGSFALTKRNTRKGRIPRTDENLKIVAKKAPKLTASKAFKDAVN